MLYARPSAPSADSNRELFAEGFEMLDPRLSIRLALFITAREFVKNRSTQPETRRFGPSTSPLQTAGRAPVLSIASNRSSST
jgi:hypothetical protein